jgi:hypothetical protein
LWGEQPGERGRGLDRDDALVVDPDALEEMGCGLERLAQ